MEIYGVRIVYDKHIRPRITRFDFSVAEYFYFAAFDPFPVGIVYRKVRNNRLFFLVSYYYERSYGERKYQQKSKYFQIRIIEFSLAYYDSPFIQILSVRYERVGIACLFGFVDASARGETNVI